jgi:hypothetical protein
VLSTSISHRQATVAAKHIWSFSKQTARQLQHVPHVCHVNVQEATHYKAIIEARAKIRAAL